jgi:very-short-patch-repair endonuclease
MSAKATTLREQRLFQAANRRFGVLHQRDLRAEGLDRNDIATRVATHRLTRLHHRVYAFGHTALRDEGWWLAALEACGGRTLLSHYSAAAYYRWSLVAPDADVHLSTTTSLRSRDGITIHRVKALARVDVHDADPFRVTTIPRTLVDLADVLTWDEYRALADRQRRLYPDMIRAAQERAGKRVGRARVTRLIEADDVHTKSEFERRFLRFLDDHELPRPDALNERVAGHLADCVYRSQRLVVELDGRAFHERRAQMRADRHRDTDYQLDGHRILRLVWDDLHPDEATRTAGRVRRMLALS